MFCFLYTFIQMNMQKLQLLDITLFQMSVIKHRTSFFLCFQICWLLQVIIQMQAHNQNNKAIYDESVYRKWSQLPPNLPLPNTPQVFALFLSFHKILYLNQMADEQPIQLKIQWWGMQKLHVVQMNGLNQQSAQVKYIVCCPLEGLLSYLTDTKLLAVDVSTKRRSIGKAFLNFILLKGWKGQRYEGIMDIKLSKAKIGELSFSIEVKLIKHPFLIQGSKQQKGNNSAIQIQEIMNNPASQNNLRKRKLSEQARDSNFELSQQVLNYDQKINQKDVVLQNQREKSLQSIGDRKSAGVRLTVEKQRNNKTLMKNQGLYNDPPTEGYQNKQLINYEKQLVRLVEDYNFLFQKTEQLMSLEDSAENMIEIQIVRLQLANKVQQNELVEVSMPLPNGKCNIYRIIPGSFVKVCIGQQSNKQQLFDYLKNSQIHFTASKGLGSVKLSRVLSKSKQIIEVPLFQKDIKDAKLKQRGICKIRVIPPQLKNDNQREKPGHKKQNQNIHQQQKHYKPVAEQYVSLFLKRFIPLQNWNRKANICVRIMQIDNSSALAQTKTVWNENLQFKIDDELTFKIVQGSNLILQVLDRQQKEVKIGEGELIMEGPIGINHQIPIYSKYMNKQVIIGYLELDYVKNGLNSVTKLRDVFVRTGNYIYTRTKAKQQWLQEKKHIVNQEKQSIQLNNQEQPSQNLKLIVDHDQQILQNQEKKLQDNIEEPRTIVKSFDRDLSSLQIFNIFFTYIYQNNQLLERLQNKESIKITEFLDIFSQLQGKKHLTLKELNIIITKHLFSNKQSDLINKINISQLENSYEAFCTYYEDLVEQRDTIIKEFLAILQNVGLSINELQYKLKNNQKVWAKMNQFLSFGKGAHINIVENLRRYYKQQQSFPYNIEVRQVTGSQFCDILRKFEVYETTLGERINYKIISNEIYSKICEVLAQIQPNFESLNYRQLTQLLQNEQIILSSWEKENLQSQLRCRHKKPQFGLDSIAQKQKYHKAQKSKKKDLQMQQQTIKQLNKPTISKSPTFGYLHAPEALKGEIIINDNQMTDSLGTKINNLPISPINFNSSKQNAQNLKIVFTNLNRKIKSFSIDGCRFHSNSFHQAHSKSLSQNENHNFVNRVNNESILQQQKNQISENRTLKSMDQTSKKQYESANSEQQGRKMEVSLQNVCRKFDYQVQIDFECQQIYLQCLHEEWTALVNQEGDYLGTILIY